MSSSREGFRFFSILDGASNANEDQAGDPEYFGSTIPGGAWVIMRHNASTGKYDYFRGVDVPSNAFGHSDLASYNTAWTNRATLEYRDAGFFKAL